MKSPENNGDRAIGSVAAVACPDYLQCTEPVTRALVLSGLLETLKGRRVLIKPNMMKGSPPETAEATHPAFVGALTRILVDAGCAVTVGDSTGIIGFTNEVFDASGMTAAVTQAGGRVINFDAGPFERILISERSTETFPVPRELFDSDAVLVVPKIKTHTFLGLTLSVKNLIGVFPGAVKCRLHQIAPGRDEFARLVAGIPGSLERAGINIAGTAVDGIVALGGRGAGVPPAPARMHCVLAGRNLFETDLVCGMLAGFAPDEVPITAAGIRAGACPPDPRLVYLSGDTIPAVSLVRSGTPIQESYPLLTKAYYAVRGRVVRPCHDSTICLECNRCIDVCPVGCLRAEGRQRTRGDGCIRCLACREVCPAGAMGLMPSRILKPFLMRRTNGLSRARLQGTRPERGK